MILIYALKHIRYMMTSSPDVRNKSTVITPFGDIVDNCCTEYSVNFNVMFEIISCRMYTWINMYRCKSLKQYPSIFFKWPNIIVEIYL